MMEQTFTLRSEHHTDFERLLAVYATVVDGRHAAYLSTPLTTGRRFQDWRNRVRSAKASSPDKAEFQSHVFEANRRAASESATRLRSRLNRPVINPAELPDQPGWQQTDYRAFWGAAIERCADMLVLSDGWELSDGCVYEFLVGLRTNASLLTIELAELAPVDGLRLIALGIEERRVHGDDPSFATKVLAAAAAFDRTFTSSSHL